MERAEMDPKDRRDLDALDELLALPAGDPARAALEADVSRKALAASHRLFCEPGADATAAHVEAADERLSAWRESAIGGSPSPDPARALRSPRPRPWWSIFATPALRPALAMAGVAIVIAGVLLWPSLAPRERGIMLRGGAGRALVLAPAHVDASGATLSWSPAPEADAYEVVFYATDLTEVARHAAGDSTSLRLTAAELPDAYRSGQPVFYRIIASLKGDETARSQVGTLQRR